MTQRVDDLVSINYDVKVLSVGWDETIQGRKVHHPGLVDQLRARLTQTTPVEEGGGNASGKPVSAPMPGSEGPLSLVVEIEVEVARLVIALGATGTSMYVVDNLAFLEVAVKTAEDDVVALAATVLAGLVRRAAVELEWAEPAKRLRASCPVCHAFGSLSVHSDAGGLAGATCEKCSAGWGRADLEYLAHLIDREAAG